MMLLFMVAMLMLLPAAGAESAVAQEHPAASPQEIIASAWHPWSRRPDFQRYAGAMARLYQSLGDRLIWLDHGRLSPQGRDAVDQLVAASTQGLRPLEYDAPTLDSLARSRALVSASDEERARFDLLLSLALIRYLDDLHSGRLGSRGVDTTQPAPERWDPWAAVAQAVAGDSIAALVEAAQPPFAQYRQLRALLARYRGLAAAVTPPAFPERGTVHPGEWYPELGELTRYLVTLGDLDSARAPDDTVVYQGPVVDGVQSFQLRHGLDPDGILGPATFRALNTPLSERVLQIELALERLRWLPPIGRQRFLAVNIPSFELFAFDSADGTGGFALKMRVIVGRSLRTRTPVLMEQLRYVEFQPYWYIPTSILRREILPKLQRLPEYLRSNEMEIVDRDNQVLGDSVTAEFLQPLRRGILRVRQRPGPRNPLGPVKFVFPNASAIYLHATPEPSLFSLPRRDFSHGCIRLEAPGELAWWVLKDRPGWTRDSVNQAMCAVETSRDTLPQPMLVIIFYTTAVAQPDGTASFYEDIYQRDKELAELLEPESIH